jgi:hypothetical protein
MATPKTCSICQLPFTEWGNNAQPINDGRCCDSCNTRAVIPARLNMIRQYDKRRKALEQMDDGGTDV